MVIECAVVVELSGHCPVEIAVVPVAGLGRGCLSVVGHFLFLDVARTVIVAGIAVEVASDSEFGFETLYDFVGYIYVAEQVDFVALVIDFICEEHGVHAFVVLGVPRVETQLSVHVLVVAAVAVVDREYRCALQGAGDYAVVAVLCVGRDIVGL